MEGSISTSSIKDFIKPSIVNLINFVNSIKFVFSINFGGIIDGSNQELKNVIKGCFPMWKYHPQASHIYNQIYNSSAVKQFQKVSHNRNNPVYPQIIRIYNISNI
jgi:hypothetical protein